MRIIGPRPVERNGLRGFVTTFQFGNTHSVALHPPGATEAGTVSSSAVSATHHASRNGEGA